MSKEKKTVELKDEELEKVAGGTPPVEEDTIQSKKLYCPDCNYFFGEYGSSITQWIERTEKYCPTCNEWVEPIVKID